MSPMTFLFDLASPYAYLSAEPGHRLAAGPAGGNLRLAGAWILGPHRYPRHSHRRDRASRGGLRTVCAQLARGVAAEQPNGDAGRSGLPEAGAGREFSLASFRRAFQCGEDLAQLTLLQEVAGEVGLDAAALPAAIADPGLKSRLKDVTVDAYARGLAGVPSFAVGEAMFYGDDHLDEALGELQRHADSSRSMGNTGR